MARELVDFFLLSYRWWVDILSFIFGGIFRVEECVELIWHPHKTIGVNVALI